MGRRSGRQRGSRGALDRRLLPLDLHDRGPSWPLGCHILAYWLSGLGLGPLSCLASSSCQILGSGSGLLCNKACCCIGLGLLPKACCGNCQVQGLLPMGLEVDLGLFPRVWWEWCRGLVALPWLLGHGGDGCEAAHSGGAPPAVAFSLEDLRCGATSSSPLSGPNPYA